MAGTFYPGDPATLRDAVDAFVGAGPADPRVPKALVVPHAGYVYSGPIAGSAYATLRPARGRIRRVVLLGPAHRVPVRGLAIPEAEVLATPLGELRVDERLRELVPWVPRNALAHAYEHSLEVQLPFVLRVLGPDVTVAPFVVGDASADDVARVLSALWGGDETVILISTDLSHYLPYEVARRVDRDTAARIVAHDVALEGERACGARALAGLALVAQARELEVVPLDLRTSGDTAGARDEVVGYGAFAYYEPDHHAPIVGQTSSERLTSIARAAIEVALGVPGAKLAPPRVEEAWLRAPGAVFVTLRDRETGELHGCTGSLEARRTLYEDVCENAVAAALRDPRAPAIDARDAPSLVVEVSELSPLERVYTRSREALLDLLVPFEHGWVLSWRGRRGTFLPQVWQSIPEPRMFLSELERKAGLAPGFWAPDLEIYRYRVTSHAEPHPDRPSPVPSRPRS